MIRKYAVLAMMACGVVFAAQTTYTSTYNFGDEGVIWDSKSGSWAEWLIGSNPTVKWSHELDSSILSSQLNSVSLTIRGEGINNIFGDWDLDGANEKPDLIKVYMNGSCLGELTGNVNTFDNIDVDALKEINKCRATLTFVYDRRSSDIVWPSDMVVLCSSTLNVSYEPVNPNPAVVPVPGAAALGGIGIALVGWLRTRKQ